MQFSLLPHCSTTTHLPTHFGQFWADKSQKTSLSKVLKSLQRFPFPLKKNSKFLASHLKLLISLSNMISFHEYSTLYKSILFIHQTKYSNFKFPLAHPTSPQTQRSSNLRSLRQPLFRDPDEQNHICERCSDHLSCTSQLVM